VGWCNYKQKKFSYARREGCDETLEGKVGAQWLVSGPILWGRGGAQAIVVWINDTYKNYLCF